MSLFPFYQTIHLEQRNNFREIATLNAQNIHQFSERIQDVTRQINSRTRIRQALENYNNGQISHQKLVEISQSKLEDALQTPHPIDESALDVAAIVRYDRSGQPVLQVGLPVPQQFWLLPPHRPAPFTLGTPFEYNGRRYLIAQSTIVNPTTGDMVGTDVVWLHTHQLEAILEGSEQNARTRDLFLLTCQNQQVRRCLGFHALDRDRETALNRAIAILSNPLRDRSQLDLESEGILVTGAMVPQTDWWVFVLQDKREVYAALNRQIPGIVAAILLLGILQTLAIALLLRPLAGSVLVRSQQLQAMLNKLRAACEQSPVSTVITDNRGIIEYVNPKFEEITGYAAAEVIGKNPNLLKSGHTSPQEYQQLWETILSGKVWYGQFRNRRKNGQLFWESALIAPIKDDRDCITHFVGIKEDITERKATEAALHYQARYDALTGILNRFSAFEEIQQVLTRSQLDLSRTAVIFLDLDRFKTINDTLGHDAGDRLLQEIAKRLQRCLRSSDIVARIGGDEFLIVLPNLDLPKDASVVVQKLLKTIDLPMRLHNEEITVSASTGIAIYPDDSRDIGELMQYADTAMYAAKRDGGNTFRFFQATMTASSQVQLRLENRLRGALERQEIYAVYQPFVELRSGVVRGAEALMRWKHPELGDVRPDLFIPMAEELGQIVPLGRWILQQACEDVKRWHQLDFPLWISVNVSAYQFRDDRFLETVLQTLETLDLNPWFLELEITERLTVSEVPSAIAAIDRLSRHHVQLAIDDFGTGYSSLSYLRQFPFQTLKIDKSFVAELPDNPELVTVVKAILAMARELNLKTIAEGVETPEQFRFLADNGCDFGQGYLFSKPLDAEAFREFLQQQRGGVSFSGNGVNCPLV